MAGGVVVAAAAAACVVRLLAYDVSKGGDRAFDRAFALLLAEVRPHMLSRCPSCVSVSVSVEASTDVAVLDWCAAAPLHPLKSPTSPSSPQL